MFNLSNFLGSLQGLLFFISFYGMMGLGGGTA